MKYDDGLQSTIVFILKEKVKTKLDQMIEYGNFFNAKWA